MKKLIISLLIFISIFSFFSVQSSISYHFAITDNDFISDSIHPYLKMIYKDFGKVSIKAIYSLQKLSKHVKIRFKDTTNIDDYYIVDTYIQDFENHECEEILKEISKNYSYEDISEFCEKLKKWCIAYNFYQAMFRLHPPVESGLAGILESFEEFQEMFIFDNKIVRTCNFAPYNYDALKYHFAKYFINLSNEEIAKNFKKISIEITRSFDTND